MGVKSFVKQVLTEQQNKKYARLMAAKTVSYDSWIREQEADALQQSLQLSQSEKSEFVCFVRQEGELATGALERIAQCFAEIQDASILYGDEDIMENPKEGVRRTPWFKPDWSPDLLKCSFYFGSMVAMRQSLWDSVQADFPLTDMGVEQDSDGSYPRICRIVDIPCFQAFIRKCVNEAGGYARSSRAVLHVAEMLFHGYSEKNWDAYRVVGNSEEAEADAVKKNFTEESCAIKSPASTLSIIIPSKDNPDILEKCLRAIPAATGTLNYEIIIVDNGSNDDNRRKIERLLQRDDIKDNVIEDKATENNETENNETEGNVIKNAPVSYIYAPQEFHFSKMCNLGAENAKGDLLLFLNDDVELAQAGSLEKLAGLAAQEYTGAVGIKLYYPDSIKIQHAGITNLPMGPVHKLQFLEDDKEYYFGYNRGCRNVLAVTAACLMVEKEKFRRVGGFAEELRVAFNDVDLCFQLYKSGYFNVCRNDCYAYHHESLSRGDDESEEKLHRLLTERDKLYARNPELAGVDPYYGPGLGRDGLDTRIRPAYETAGNSIQQITGLLKNFDIKSYRQDNCLLFRVEDSRECCIQGYGVVLGDNNACYDRWLIFKRIEKANTLPEKLSTKRCAKQPDGTICVAIEAEEQYRPDLAENMSDQINVGLCGYWVRIETGSLPEGEYRIGMAVCNRVTGLKLMNWSNRSVAVTERHG